VILPVEWAGEFAAFCERNPRPCPLLEVTDPGSFVPVRLAPEADLRTDLPRYRIWQQGRVVEQPSDILRWWQDDFVAFLIGCSFTFDGALLRAGLPVRHIQQGVNVPMYRTSLECVPAGPFAGSLVVSMRPLPQEDVPTVVDLTARFGHFHGAPVHSGTPAEIGIRDLSRPDFGDPVTIREGEVPVFWACGVTPQVALMSAQLPLAITHAPGHMFVTDLTDEDVLVRRPDMEVPEIR
jgi:uncharacterized protein YcsI (UPF0317 family)